MTETHCSPKGVLLFLRAVKKDEIASLHSVQMVYLSSVCGFSD